MTTSPAAAAWGAKAQPTETEGLGEPWWGWPDGADRRARARRRRGRLPPLPRRLPPLAPVLHRPAPLQRPGRPLPRPRRWIVLDKALGRRRFINFTTGECIRVDLRELADHTLLALTPEGLLLLLHEPTRVVRLLNPLTRQLTDLPPVTSLLTEEQRTSGCLGDYLWVSGVGLADASTVAVAFRHPVEQAVFADVIRHRSPGRKRRWGVDADPPHAVRIQGFAR
ncbi:hypothetical protein PR202_gb21417 [Eleusine coracana subsp. coracana]|uniref:Uncharacterized protein n=1 Tax=Eleusine coracana subsp. coracana TaxID=191504 RepID=A0AAV5FB31_ELECO|nr:hypothetical protein PR202_gb21417 [Eleusine coracana subsp. coracana]